MNNYTGVTLVAASGKYRAQINRRGRIFYLGIFESAEQAAGAYDRAVLLTRNWELRPTKLNLEEGPNSDVPPDKQFWTRLEKDMVAFLQNNFPVDEGTLRNQRATELETPDVLINLAVSLEKARSHQRHLEDAYIRDSKDWMLSQAKKIAELKAKVAHLEVRLEDVDKERADALATRFSPTGQLLAPTAQPTPKSLAEASIMKECVKVMAADIISQLDTPAESAPAEAAKTECLQGQPGDTCRHDFCKPVSIGPEGAPGAEIAALVLNEAAEKTLAEQSKVSEVTVAVVDQALLDKEALLKVSNPFGRKSS